MANQEQDPKIQENLNLLIKKNVDVDLITTVIRMLNMSQADFAESLGVSRVYLSAVFNGKYPISDTLAVQINKNLDKKVKSLLKKSDNPQTILLKRAMSYIVSKSEEFEADIDSMKADIVSAVLKSAEAIIEDKKKEINKELSQYTEECLKASINSVEAAFDQMKQDIKKFS